MGDSYPLRLARAATGEHDICESIQLALVLAVSTGLFIMRHNERMIDTNFKVCGDVDRQDNRRGE